MWHIHDKKERSSLRQTARLAKLLKEEAGDPETRGKALNLAGNLAYMQSDYEEAQRRYEESLEILRPLGARQSVAALTHNLGLIAWIQSRFVEARTLTEPPPASCQ